MQMKQAKILKSIPKIVLKVFLLPVLSPNIEDLIKFLELAIVNAALFQYLTKQKNVKIVAISIQDIKC